MAPSRARALKRARGNGPRRARRSASRQFCPAAAGSRATGPRRAPGRRSLDGHACPSTALGFGTGQPVCAAARPTRAAPAHRCTRMRSRASVVAPCAPHPPRARGCARAPPLSPVLSRGIHTRSDKILSLPEESRNTEDCPTTLKPRRYSKLKKEHARSCSPGVDTPEVVQSLV